MNIIMVALGTFLFLAGAAGLLLFWWLPLINLLTIGCGLLGFVLLIIGLVIPSERRQEPIIIQQQPYSVQQPASPQTILAICPQCKNRIPSDSSFCPRCGTDLRPPISPPPRTDMPQSASPPLSSKSCRTCGAQLGEHEAYCKKCGTVVPS
jgi:hypothetical protein